MMLGQIERGIKREVEDQLGPLIGVARSEDYEDIGKAISSIMDRLRLKSGVPAFGIMPKFKDGRLTGVSVSLKLEW
jgi:hypothetical protein